MGIRDRPISRGSPWQSAYVERLIGTVRRDCLDQMLVFGERTCGKFFLLMQRTTIRSARTWHWTRVRPGSGGAALRCHNRHSNLVRAAPPLRPDMIFGKDTGSF